MIKGQNENEPERKGEREWKKYHRIFLFVFTSAK